MFVGTLQVTLHLEQTFSLKDKRRVVKSLMTKLQNDFNISIAEVDHQDEHRMAALGVAIVANDGRFTQQVLDRIVSRLEGHPDVMLEDWHSDVV